MPMLLRAVPRELSRLPDTPERVNKSATTKGRRALPGRHPARRSAAELAGQEARLRPAGRRLRRSGVRGQLPPDLVAVVMVAPDGHETGADQLVEEVLQLLRLLPALAGESI